MLTLYTKNNCVYCKLAKDYLNSIGVEFCEIDVSKDIRAADMLKSMGLKTVPQIFYKGKLFISGGYNGLVKYNKNQILDILNKYNLE